MMDEKMPNIKFFLARFEIKKGLIVVGCEKKYLFMN